MEWASQMAPSKKVQQSNDGVVSVSYQEALLTWGVSGLLVLLAVYLLLPVFKQYISHRREERRISRLGKQQLRNVILDDGMDGKVFIEWLSLAPEGLLVIARNTRDGHIFGGERIDTWAQVVGKQTSRFDNPLYAVGNEVAAVKYHVPDVPVSGIVVFVGDCSFPKGQPANTILLGDIPVRNRGKKDVPINISLQKAWARLEEQVETASNKELNLQEGEKKKGRLFAAVLLILLTAGWLGWRLMMGD